LCSQGQRVLGRTLSKVGFPVHTNSLITPQDGNKNVNDGGRSRSKRGGGAKATNETVYFPPPHLPPLNPER